MDKLTRQIAAFAADLKYEELPESVVGAATRFLVDSLACAIAAYDCEAAQMGLRLARGAAPERFPGRIICHGEISTAESAAFVNTTMIRSLDFNDEYPGGHPSDCLGAFLAMAEAAKADGHKLIESLIIAYELFVRLSDATGLRYKGWDQGFAVGIGVAAGVGHMLNFSRQQLAEAISIIAVANMPMRNTRAGELSLWKGVATAFAARNGVFAALLAGEGMTGADQPFEGKHGLWDLITGPFQLTPLPTEGGPFQSPVTRLKYWPVEYNGQLAVWAALELRQKADWRELNEIEIGVYTFCYTEIASEPEKWDPKTRETADHSLPYIFTKALVDGTMTIAAFEDSAYRDPSIRPLMNKIRVDLDKEVDALYPKTISMKIKATKKDRSVIELWPRDPLGHVNKPMGNDDVKSKFLRTVEPVYGKEKTTRVLERWWDVSKASATEVAESLALLDVKN
jgi:2-methylcitrate dehydratase